MATALRQILSYLLLPASSEDPVELHKALELATSRLRESQFSGIERPLTIQNFEIGCRSSAITHLRKSNRFLQIHVPFSSRTAVAIFLIL